MATEIRFVWILLYEHDLLRSMTYKPTEAEKELLLKLKGVTLEDIQQLAWVFSMLMSEGSNSITPVSLQTCYRTHFRMDFSNDQCNQMISIFIGNSNLAAGEADHIDFTHFAKRVVSIRNGDEPGVAAGSFGTFFDMASGTSGQLELGSMQSVLQSLDVNVVQDEAQDMLLYSQSLNLGAGSMGFTGDKSALPPQLPLDDKD